MSEDKKALFDGKVIINSAGPENMYDGFQRNDHIKPVFEIPDDAWDKPPTPAAGAEG